MNGIPDWAWKVLQLFILPVALWAIATHVTIKNQDLKIDAIQQQSSIAEKQLDGHDSEITQTQQDIEILKVRMEYVAQGIDDIKRMLEDQDK